MPRAVTRDRGLPPRKATDVTLPEALLKEAGELGVSLSQECERGVAASVAEARTRQWQRDNRDALDAWNEYVEQHGLPLGEFRAF